MTVRVCKPSDIPWLLEKAIRFNDMYFDIPLSPGKTEEYIASFVSTGWDRIALRNDTGAILGMVYDDPCRHWQVLVEIAWYAEGKGGLELLRAFEAKGRELEVDEIRMTTLHKSSQRTEFLLLRKGYMPIETSHRLLI